MRGGFTHIMRIKSILHAVPAALLFASGSVAQYNGPFSTSIQSSAPITTLDSKPGDPGTTTLDANYLYAYPEAVCNDGTPAAYYMSKGTGSGSDTWLVYLEGSMFCWDQNSCDMRYQSKDWWMSSKDWEPQMAQGGIFSNVASESPFYNANLIWVKYCSSDLWNGDANKSSATFGFYFKGSQIIQATIQDLIKTHGMGAQPGQRLVFGGCSAGGIGAMNALDSVAAMVPPGLEVQGLLDAAALLNVNPQDNGWQWGPLLEPLQNLTAKLLAFDNPQLPEQCLQMYPEETWKCTWGSFRLPLISTPYFMTASQFDSFELSYMCDNYVPSTPQQLAFVDSFQTDALQLFNEVPSTTSIYSSTCLTHCLTDQATFYTFSVNGITPETAVREWFFDHEKVRVISGCQGYSCTNQCGLDSEGLPCNMGSPGCKIYPGPTEGAFEPPAPKTGGGKKKGKGSSNNGGGGDADEQQSQGDDFGAVKGSEPSLGLDQQKNLGSFVGQQEQQQQQQR